MNNKPIKQEPKCWGMLDKDGNIYDVISPEEHARAEGSYKEPLYTHPKELSLTDAEKTTLIWQNHLQWSVELMNLAEAILRKASEK